MAILNTSGGLAVTLFCCPWAMSSINNILPAVLRPITQKCSWLRPSLFSRFRICCMITAMLPELLIAAFLCASDSFTFHRVKTGNDWEKLQEGYLNTDGTGWTDAQGFFILLCRIGWILVAFVSSCFCNKKG